MPSLSSSLVLVFFATCIAVCAIGLLVSRMADEHRTRARARRRELASGSKAVVTAEGIERRGSATAVAAGAEIDAAFDRLASRRGVPRDQVTGAMVDQQFRRDVRITWRKHVVTARRPRPTYVPGAVDARGKLP